MSWRDQERAMETRLDMQRSRDEEKALTINERAYELYDQWVNTPAVIADEISAVLASNHELAKALIFGDGIAALMTLREATEKSMRENAGCLAEDQIETEIEQAAADTYLSTRDEPITYGRVA